MLYRETLKLGVEVFQKHTGGDSGLILYKASEDVGIGVLTVTYNDLLKDFTFEDGSPCGIEE